MIWFGKEIVCIKRLLFTNTNNYETTGIDEVIKANISLSTPKGSMFQSNFVSILQFTNNFDI